MLLDVPNYLIIQFGVVVDDDFLLIKMGIFILNSVCNVTLRVRFHKTIYVA